MTIPLMVAALGAAALAALVYAGYAIGPRRGVFARLASDPTSVEVAAAESSDGTNGVLFVAAAVLTILASAMLGWWSLRGRSTVDPVHPAGAAHVEGAAGASGLGAGWAAVGGAGIFAVLAAFVLHAGGGAGRIAFGYVVLGIGAALVAGAMGWAAVALARSRSRS